MLLTHSEGCVQPYGWRYCALVLAWSWQRQWWELNAGHLCETVWFWPWSCGCFLDWCQQKRRRKFAARVRSIFGTDIYRFVQKTRPFAIASQKSAIHITRYCSDTVKVRLDLWWWHRCRFTAHCHRERIFKISRICRNQGQAQWHLFMAAVCNRQAVMFSSFGFFFFLSSFFFSSAILSHRRLDVCQTSTHDVALLRI